MSAIPLSSNSKNAWMVALNEVTHFEHYTLSLDGGKNKYKAITEGDWILIVNKSAKAAAIGQVYRDRKSVV